MDNVSLATQSSHTSGGNARLPASIFASTRSGGTLSNTSSGQFDPIQYVNELTSKPSVTLDSLLHARKTVQNYADETNTQLKKNVYKNYQLFIDTSKEISYLKKEMSQLSRLLNEETKLLDGVMGISIGGSKTGLTPSEKKEALEKVKEERERKMLQMSKSNLNGPLPTKEFKSILESIEGGAGIIENKQDSLVYFEGEVVELDDQQDYRELHSMYLVLLNDSLILNTVLPVDRMAPNVPKITFSIAGGPGGGNPTANNIPNSQQSRKYKFQSIIDIETIAVVNVKDRRFPKYEMAFKVLMSATTKVFLTNSTAKKRAWMETFEMAKKYRRSSSRLQRRDTILFPSSSVGTGSAQSTGAGGGHGPDSGYTSATPSVNESKTPSAAAYTSNPFDEPEIEDPDAEPDPELPYWLMELPDDLDVYIAQRNFEDAVKLVSRAHEHFFLYPKWCDHQRQVDLKLRIDNKISELVDALTSELNVAPDRSLQTGPRASRRAVSLLLRLGKSSLAIRLFLDQRTKLMKHSFKQQKGDGSGATLSFIKRMTNLYFHNIVETSKEFLLAFEINVKDLEPSSRQFDSQLESFETTTGPTGKLTTPNRQNSEEVSIDEPSSSHSASTPTMSFSHAALACLNTWNYHQFKDEYLELFKRHVFISAVSREVAVECIAVAHEHCVKLRKAIGVDFSFVLSRELRRPIEALIGQIQTQFIDAIKQRAETPTKNSKMSIQEQTFDTKEKLSKFTSEMKALDLDVEEYIHQSQDERSDPPKPIYLVQLTANTTSFAKSYLNTLRDLLKLCTHPTVVKRINEVMVTGFKTQMAHMAACLKRLSGGNPELVRLNIAFVLDRLLPVVVRKYCDELRLRSFNDLQVLSKDYAYLKDVGASSGGQQVTTSFSTNSTPTRSAHGSPFGSPMPAPRLKKNTTQIAVNQSSPSRNGPSSGGGGSGTGGGGSGAGSSNGTNWSVGTYL